MCEFAVGQEVDYRYEPSPLGTVVHRLRVVAVTPIYVICQADGDPIPHYFFKDGWSVMRHGRIVPRGHVEKT